MKLFMLSLVATCCSAFATSPSHIESVSSTITINTGNVYQIETSERNSETTISLGTSNVIVRAGLKRSMTLRELTVLEVSEGVVLETPQFVASAVSGRIAVNHEGPTRVVFTTALLQIVPAGKIDSSKVTCGGNGPSGSFSASNGTLYRNGNVVPGNRYSWAGGYIEAEGNEVRTVIFPYGDNPDCMLK